MYEPPLELVTSQFQNMIIEQQENLVFQAIRNIGVNVDKAELLKALKYDRNQYQKGYDDGYKAGRLATLNEIIEKMQGGCL